MGPREKSGNFGHQVNLDSGLVCFFILIIRKQKCIKKANSENSDVMSHPEFLQIVLVT